MTDSVHPNVRAGVLFNVMSSALFALMYAYTSLLRPMSGLEVYGWRILLTVPCLMALVIGTGHWHEVRSIWARVRGQRGFWLQRLLSSALLNVQLWLFMWAPLNGHGLDVSMGYFVLPISMVVLGRAVFKDRITRLQLLACALALVGVGLQLAVARTIAWPALLVCLGYPLYFWLRRATDTNTLGSLWADMALSLPLIGFMVVRAGGMIPADAPASMPWLILGLGAISAAALGCQALSAPRLNVTLFGLLIYVEPVLLVVASLLLGETIPAAQWPAYVAIWLAVMVLVAEGVLALRRGPRASPAG